jgi:hypothetical protein
MPTTITYNFTANVSGGPSITASNPVDVEAYDQIEVIVPSSNPTTVNVQPGSGGQLLVITASTYENVTYTVDSTTTVVTLDGPHILIGAGAIALLGNTQNDLIFTNGGSEDITVSILVGRDATP